MTSQRVDHGYLQVPGVSRRVCVIHLLNLGTSRNVLPAEETSIFMSLSWVGILTSPLTVGQVA